MCFSRQADGHPVRLQVHRDVSDHQLQRGRATGGHTDADPAQAGPATGPARRVPVHVHAQTVQVAVSQLRAHVQEIPWLPHFHQPPGQGSAEQGLGPWLQVKVVREPARAVAVSVYKRVSRRSPEYVSRKSEKTDNVNPSPLSRFNANALWYRPISREVMTLKHRFGKKINTRSL